MTISKKARTMTHFTSYSATQKLKQLALEPFDLREPGNLTPERLQEYYGESCGYKLLYGAEQVTPEVIEALTDLSKEAEVLDKMERMQAGEVTNYIEGYPCDNRAVLHTAVRDFFDDPNPDPRAKEATEKARSQVEKLKGFLDRIDDRYRDMIMIAIGGSDLGPKANYSALRHMCPNDRKIHFISNVDPDNAAMVLSQVDPKQTLVVVVSKSGTTLETVSNEAFVRQFFEQSGCDPKEHFVSVTGEGSPMDDSGKYLECFHIWDWVGGRFSTTSMVGGVMLSFAFGFDTYWEILRGANAMDKAAKEKELHKNLPLLSALLGIWNHNFLGYPTMAVVPYSEGLNRYAAHIQQVDMESNGKWIDQQGKHVDFETGPIVWGEPGTNAQHSFFQLIHQGTATVPVEFIGYKESQCGKDVEIDGTTSHEKLLANLFAQSLALALGQKSDNPNQYFPGNRPSHILLGKKLTPFALGALLCLTEHKVAFQGFIWNINSFDQEGVQLGKVLANQIIDRFAARKGKSKGGVYPLGDVLIDHLGEL